MKKSTLFIIIIFYALQLSQSFADWEKVVQNKNETSFYVDFDGIQNDGRYVYFWVLTDYLKPQLYEVLSTKVYRQGDCNLFRYKFLNGSFHKKQMGGGTGISSPPPNKWKYPPTDSSIEQILSAVCQYAK